ncbi:2,3-dihydroxy-2,3-dihydrophenylpropionate dehydrogenase, partial [Alcaligenes faecalis subsp. faecalis NCIB 8687]
WMLTSVGAFSSLYFASLMLLLSSGLFNTFMDSRSPEAIKAILPLQFFPEPEEFTGPFVLLASLKLTFGMAALAAVINGVFGLILAWVLSGYGPGLAAGLLAGSQTISASIGLATNAINRLEFVDVADLMREVDFKVFSGLNHG